MPDSTDSCPNCPDTPPSDTEDINWIQCDICRQWFHTTCIGTKEEDIAEIASYHCAKCAKKHGPSQLRRLSKRARVKIDYVALDQGETFAVDKSVHPHVPSFKEFGPEVDPKAKKQVYVDILASDELTKEYVLATGLPRPVLVPRVVPEEAGMSLPCKREDVTVSWIASLVGEEESVEVMDVLSQQSESPGWNLGQWKKYFYMREKDRIRNVISLEVSDVKGLGDIFVRPQMVRDMDLVDKVWSQNDTDEERPKVTTYCLMSIAGSYTDFHIDFSGTPVYYTICHGSKTFLMYPPTKENLELYTSWCKEPQQNFTWFGTYSKRINGKKLIPSGGFKVNLAEGDLFIIPSGWIHSVYTPQDSVIIGGNYLTVKDIPMHLQIYNIEKTTGVPSRYRFPKFNRVLWLTSYYYLNHQEEFLQDCLSKGAAKPNMHSSEALQSASQIIYTLVAHLTEHYELGKTKPVAKKAIPTAIIGKDVPQFLEKLNKWAAQIPSV
ncbi:hypothetical protein FT663_03190 [Candidozyma haemuli var. vulneris]|uniref:JmjC domain-containing histone demethylation protein 1 n=1 Tax=Candidozyma haemuli TaxID=45357 RepID=A0A2V1AL59_9ASCO|nr:hypothetical protein CXQ85_000901 [[Candida] haemuloni]KAF3987632.1 hypothetical protein FT662_03880 [[Candida] haemuloni var. vulneris]KAF3990432.1 hypothetical protein FT663_03190 [[Candida] haemuloni var. vulneris]PVH18619.1 hypothetical protein CXQ85_000901 [[Candida] haemuloni]